MEYIKVFFYDANGYEVFDRTFHVESIKQLIYVLNETLFNNNDVDSYYIEGTVEVEKNESK